MSKTFVLAIVGIVNVGAPLIGFELTDSAALENVINLAVLVGIVVNRFLKGDISVLGLKKKV